MSNRLCVALRDAKGSCIMGQTEQWCVCVQKPFSTMNKSSMIWMRILMHALFPSHAGLRDQLSLPTDKGLIPVCHLRPPMHQGGYLDADLLPPNRPAAVMGLLITHNETCRGIQKDQLEIGRAHV